MTTNERQDPASAQMKLMRDLRRLVRRSPDYPQFKRDLRAHLLQQAHTLTQAEDRSSVLSARPFPAATHQWDGRSRDAAFMHALDAWARHQRQAEQTGKRVRVRRQRRLAAGLAILLTIVGAAGYLQFQAATPAAAAVILQRAAHALAPAPHQVLHAVYTLTSCTGVTSSPTGVSTCTLDTWIQADASGAITRQAITYVSSTGMALSRTILTRQTATTYDPARNTIMTATIDPNSAAAGVSNPFDPVRLLQVTQGSDQHARLLSQRILDGVTVDVVQVARTPSESTAAQEIVTFYIDAHSYILRRVEITTGPTRSAPTFTLRFVAYGIVPLSRVPPHTFTLNAPATAHVVIPVNHVQQLSVAQAVALPAMPAPLLPGAPDGLRLKWISEAVLPQLTFLRYAYFGAHQDVVVMVLSGQAQAVQHLTSGDPVGRSLTLTVAGHTVSAMYAYRADVPGQATHFLTYRLGQATVRIVGSGQSKAQFFAVIKALVDGKTHPAVVAQLQHELYTP